MSASFYRCINCAIPFVEASIQDSEACQFADISRRKIGAPTGEQFERFLSPIVSLVTPNSLEVPSYMWLQRGVGHLVKACVLTSRTSPCHGTETQRIATMIDYLWQEGRLTEEPKFERN